MQKITPFLWFNGNAEEAMNFYTSVFKNATVKNLARFGPEGKLITATFQLEGQEFIILDGGPQFAFTEAVSFLISCETQEEVDMYWNALTKDGAESRCGWLKDKYGLSWQVVPTVLSKLLQDKDPAKAQSVMQAMMQMNKIIIEDLEQAYAAV